MILSNYIMMDIGEKMVELSMKPSSQIYIQILGY